MHKFLGLFLLLTFGLSYAEPVDLDVSFISTLTQRKYFKYNAALNQYIPVTRQVSRPGGMQTVDYEAMYVNNDKYWAGKYSSFGTGGITTGVNYDFYTEESYYLFMVSTVGMGPIADDAQNANYALDLICGKYFGQHTYPTLQLLQLPWSFNDLYDKRGRFEYDPYALFEEIAASPVAGEFKLTADRSLVEPYDKISARLMLKGLQACENEVTDESGHKRYEYGIYTLKVKDAIDFNKCGGAKDYKLIQGSNLLSASLTDANGNEVSGLSNGLLMNICVNGYTTPGWGFTIEKVRVRHKSSTGDQLATPTQTTVCPDPEYAFKVAEVFKLFEQLSVVQAGTRDEKVAVEALSCDRGGHLASLTSGALRLVSRSKSVVGYKIDWSERLAKNSAIFDPKEPYPAETCPTHTYSIAGTYNIIVYATILYEFYDTRGRYVCDKTVDREIIRRQINVRPAGQPKTRAEMAAHDKPLIPVRVRLQNDAIGAGRTLTCDAYESITTGPAYTVENSGVLDLRAPVVSLCDGTWFKDRSRVCITAIDGLTAMALKARNDRLETVAPAVHDTAVHAGASAPDIFLLEQNQPNPFNPATTIRFILPQTLNAAQTHKARLQVFNLKGNCVRTLLDGPLGAGAHQAVWDGRDGMGRPVAAGIYVYQINAGKFRSARKMTLLK
ncbi:MAG: FlgD immunoglobulin-like domain containing protein [Fibrobacterota bacterium]